ncbi:MAG: Uma2 family endonuclease [Anaerolineae bacterium]|nr:Uma2 family endonuclease [Anaerolineae bacterium]
MVATDIHAMTLEQFMESYSDDGPFEWIDGERIPVSPQVAHSGRVAFRLGRILSQYVEANRLGEVFAEVPFVKACEEHQNWVKGSRQPDLMFVRAERLAALAAVDPQWERKPLTIVPDLTVEVVSPTDRLGRVTHKIDLYIQDGVSEVWLVEPESQTVTITRSGSNLQTRIGARDIPSVGAMYCRDSCCL